MNDDVALKERIDGVEKMMLALRTADMEAIRVARDDVKERMGGFPAEYARKSELEQIRETALRLDKTAMPRDAYESAHEQLEADISKLLPRETFEATLKEWTTWRRAMDDATAARRGGEVTLAKMAGLITLAATVISIVILLANNTLG